MTTFDLEAHLSTLRLHTRLARDNYEIWWTIIGIDTRGKYLDAMNEFPGYFLIAERTHEDAVLSYTAKLFDRRSDVVSLHTTLSLAKQTGKLTQETIDYIEDGLTRFEPVINGVRHIRHKNLSHIDNRESREAAFKNANITANQIRDVITFVDDALNRIDGEVFNHGYSFSSSAKHHVIGLLEFIDEARCAPKRKMFDEAEVDLKRRLSGIEP